eukprot:scaffold483_cov107-Isochrysis_galbana.AAC.8
MAPVAAAEKNARRFAPATTSSSYVLISSISRSRLDSCMCMGDVRSPWAGAPLTGSTTAPVQRSAPTTSIATVARSSPDLA